MGIFKPNQCSIFHGFGGRLVSRRAIGKNLPGLAREAIENSIMFRLGARGHLGGQMGKIV